MLGLKFKGLLQAYKTAKDNAGQTGAGKGYIPYEEQLDEIFGDRPIITYQNVLGFSGVNVSQVALPVRKTGIANTTVTTIPQVTSETAVTVAVTTMPVTPTTTTKAITATTTTTPNTVVESSRASNLIKKSLKNRKSEREKQRDAKLKEKEERFLQSETSKQNRHTQILEELKAMKEERQVRFAQRREDAERRHRELIAALHQKHQYSK